MTFQDYNSNIPNPPNRPSSDVPLMQTNTNSISALINIDHYGFNNNLGGYHSQVQMPVQSPFTGVLGNGTLYTQSIKNSSAGNEATLFYTPGPTGNAYQLTRTITGSYALFADFTNNYGGSGTAYTGGWTYLPGGLLFQYGFYNAGAGGIGSKTGSINFPVAFLNPPFVVNATLTILAQSSSIHQLSILNGSLTTNLFKWTLDDTTSNFNGIYWTAIGY